MPELVALAIPPGQAFVDELQRAWDVGDAVLPIDLRLPPPAIETLVESLGVGVLVDESGDRHLRATGRPTEDGDALVVATSGSTGEPKGVVLTHDAVRSSATMTSRRLDVTSEDHWLACLPLAHIGGLSVVTRSLIMEKPFTVLPRFDAETVEAHARKGATLVSLVTAAMRRIDTSLFRCILLGGAAPPHDLPANVVPTYGMTETGSGVVYDYVALDGVSLRTDEGGELWVRSPTLLRCYRDGSDPKTADGWFATGDAASIDNDERLTVFGRMAEVINTGGEKVWPAVVERVLRAHPLVAEALVFGEADNEWGERVVAAVEPAHPGEAPSLEELRDLVKAELPPYAAPKEVRVVEKLERTANGKLKRATHSPSSRTPASPGS